MLDMLLFTCENIQRMANVGYGLFVYLPLTVIPQSFKSWVLISIAATGLLFPATSPYFYCFKLVIPRQHVEEHRINWFLFLILNRLGIRVSVMGDLSKLPEQLQKLVMEVAETTKENSVLHFIVAVSYSGQYDIVQACKSIAQQVKDGHVVPEDIDKSMIEQELQTNCTEYPYPDLLIRTSGELRVSNFMLWQMAYTELCFFSTLWPDFGRDDFVEALLSFQQRKRRYGMRNS